MALRPVDWNLCVICGLDLKCPADSLQGNGLEVYSNFLTVVEEFRELDALPVNVTINYRGEQIPQLFLQNRAKWHKSCHLKFAPSEQIGKKRQHPTAGDEQRRSKRRTTDEESCIFCSQTSGKLLSVLPWVWIVTSVKWL